MALNSKYSVKQRQISREIIDVKCMIRYHKRKILAFRKDIIILEDKIQEAVNYKTLD